MKQAHAAFWSGILFAFGLSYSGMTQPNKIIGFLDLLNWDASLVFVMMGSILVHSISYRIVTSRATPIFDLKWHLPTKKDITPSLVIGSALFGLGWGMGGFCPGPAVTSLAAGNHLVIAFVISMLFGMWTYNKIKDSLPFKK
jgi:uncharacterized membrane protein YedE/YeeE